MAKKKIVFLFLLLLFLLLFIFFMFFYNSNNAYSTINGIRVTKKNLSSLIKPVPKSIYNAITDWFEKNNAYGVIVRQKELLTDVGTSDRDSKHFFKIRDDITNIGGMNYIFKLPNSSLGIDLIVKISGPSNRLYNTVAGMGLGLKTAYFRSMHAKVNSKHNICCKYFSFAQDKEQIKKYLYSCFPGWFLQKKPTKRQLKELAYELCGALAQKSLSGVAEYALYEKYLYNKNFSPKTFYQATNMFLDKIYDTIRPLCYTKEEFLGKSFADTYNTASRVFHMARFNEAINTFNLDRLQKAPQAYVVNVNPKRPNSCSDKDVVVVQHILKNCKHVDFYIKKHPEVINKIFTKEVICQFCRALQYSGLWDINGDNIFINQENNKIIYMDYEHARNIAPSEAFNQNKSKVKDSFCQALAGLLRLFKNFSHQVNIILSFIKDNNIDLDAYIQKRSLRGRKVKRNFEHASPLGYMLCYQDIDDPGCQKCKQIVYKRLGNIN